MKVLESKGEQEERTTPKCYSRCSHFSREHEASPDLSVSEHSWCRNFLKPSENVKEGTLVEDERLKRQRGKECRQTWRGGGIVQLDGATGGGGREEGLEEERAAVQSLREMTAQRQVVYHTSCMDTGLILPLKHQLFL